MLPIYSSSWSVNEATLLIGSFSFGAQVSYNKLFRFFKGLTEIPFIILASSSTLRNVLHCTDAVDRGFCAPYALNGLSKHKVPTAGSW